jgi:hypothetical protein
MRDEETDTPGMQQRHKGPRRKTAPTSGKGEDAPLGHQAQPASGDRKIASRVFHPTTGTGGQDTVEVPAPAEAEEVVL